MTQDRSDDLRDRPIEEEQLGDEEVAEGRDVHDLTRSGRTHGRDVTTNAVRPDIETHGLTVVDRSHVAESHGMDVLDEGPAEPGDDEPLLP